ncbi:hypothetical protein A7U43_23840 [Mycobacterium adipatum]|uniref:Uncharacterized protein n=1 Tax=Mycobacterium adipatum TaxID=1682113 RepID=A0A172US85_9MYCO|nr:hypothetical protein [Mycobacterium adipatum]ANE81896.1 hypothetical protein A7U43_23840 [Mycobacterium adipatum]
MEDEQEEVERVRDWVGRLEGFASALDDIDGETPSEFCENACYAWQSAVMIDPPPRTSPAMAIALEGLNALLQVMVAVAMDWADTPDVRDRFTRDSAQDRSKDALDRVVAEGHRWLDEGLPPSDDVKQRISAVVAAVAEAKDTIESKNAELDTQDAEAEADQYGAILLYRDHRVSDAPIFTKVCSFTEEENTRYVKAYDRLRRMLDSELLQHIQYESDRLMAVLIGVLRELGSQQLSLTNYAAMDEWKRKLRSALISFTAALQIHEYQTIRSARRTLGLGREQVDAIKQLFADLKRESFDYRWLEALRDALQHGDINAFRWSFNVSMRSDPEVIITMDRAYMLDDFLTDNRTKPWLKRRELEELDSDPNVLDMIKAVQPLMGPLQERLDKVLYPNTAQDAATVRELIGRFEGRQGAYYLQTGPGFTRRRLAPPQMPLEPRVLGFADTYQADDEEGGHEDCDAGNAAAS